MTYESQLAHSLTPYQAGEQPTGDDWIKLNTNESPYPPSPEAIAAAQAAGAHLRLYPDPESTVLRDAIANCHGLRRENVFIGNGSDEVLAFSFAAFFAQAHAATPEIGYSFYPSYARLFCAALRLTPVDAAFQVEPEGLLSPGLPVILANPNAPTSRTLPKETILQMARKQESQGRILIVDEAYALFGDGGVAGRCAEFENLLVIRTFSKAYGLAGLRVGYALGAAPLIRVLETVRDSFNSYPVDRLAQAAAAAAIRDDAYTQSRVQAICETRGEAAAALRNLGFEVPDSSTNFLFARCPGIPGAALFEALRARKILVRRFDRPRIQDHLRISVGTPAQMRALTKALAEILAQNPPAREA